MGMTEAQANLGDEKRTQKSHQIVSTTEEQKVMQEVIRNKSALDSRVASEWAGHGCGQDRVGGQLGGRRGQRGQTQPEATAIPWA